MRGLVWLLLLFSLAVSLSLAGRFDPGYAVLVYPPWRVELSLATLLLLLLLLLLVVGLLWRMLSAMLALPGSVRAYRGQQHIKAGQEALLAAMRADLAHQPAACEAAARRAIELQFEPALAAQLAARAAAAQQAPERQAYYLRLIP
jgi:HemY protein